MKAHHTRAAAFACAIALCYPGGRLLLAEGRCDGSIGFRKDGAGGFGYDPLFFLPEYGQTFAELPPTIKNRISHRAKALLALKDKLCV